MSKTAKNIKQFRTEKELSQEALAEKISVSRQTVSSWETGRTQPDIEMLELLSKELDVGIEELIYGKKNRVGFEPDKKPDKKIITIVLTVLGTLFTSVGLVMVFAAFWEDLSSFKNVFAFLPLAVGFGLSVFVLMKRSGSALWREGASVAWVVGIAATNALLNSINSADLGFALLLFIDTFLILPVMLIMRSAFPSAAFFVGIAASTVLMTEEASTKGTVAVMISCAVLFAAGFVFTLKNRFGDRRDALMFWVRLLASGFELSVLFGIFAGRTVFSNQIQFGFRAAYLFFLVLYCIGPRFSQRGVVQFGAAPLSVFAMVMTPLQFEYYYARRSQIAVLYVILIAFAVIALAFRFGELKKDKLKIGIAVSVLAVFIADLIMSIDKTPEAARFIVFAFIALLVSVLFIIKGINRNELVTVNFGTVSAAVVVTVFLIFAEIEPYVIGLAVASSGIILLVVNRRMLKKVKAAEKEAEENA